MRAPFAWIALGLVVGAYTFLWLVLPVWGLVLGLICSIVAVGFNNRWSHPFGFCTLGFVMSQATIMLQPQQSVSTHRIAGQVVSTAGRHASIQTQSGMVWAKFHPKAPPSGTWIVGSTKPLSPEPALPGAWLSHAQSKLAKAQSVRFTHWTQLNPSTPKIELPSSLEHRGILHALGTGDRTQMSKETTNLLRRTGVIHLLAISGLHIGIIATIGGFFGWIISRPLTRGCGVFIAKIIPHLSAIHAAIIYGEIVNWPVSAQRAVCMLLATSVTLIFQRRVNPWQILGSAVMAVFVWDASQIASLGFLLSFSAVIALIGWMPLWSALLPDQSPMWVRWVHNSMGTTVCASFGTLPICAWVFQQFPIAAPLANVLAVPLFAMVAVPATLMGTLGPNATSQPLLELANMAVSAALWWVRLWDIGAWSPAVGWGGALILWLSLFCFKRPRLAFLGLIVCLSPYPTPRQSLEVHFPDVGQGSSCLVRWPDGRHWLIDGGPPGRRILNWLRRQGVRKIDRVFLTHPDADHMGGLLPIIDAIEVGEVWTSQPIKSDPSQFRALHQTARENGVPVHHWDRVFSGNGSDNDTGLVMAIRHGAHQFLLLGDISAEIEKRMAENMPTMTIVNVAHHGSKTSSHPQLIKKSQADWAVIQAGFGNRYGHPHSSVIKRWGIKNILRTHIDGSVRFITDGASLKISTWKPQTGWKKLKN